MTDKGLEGITLTKFLEEMRIGVVARASEALDRELPYSTPDDAKRYLRQPTIRGYCESPECSATMYFQGTTPFGSFARVAPVEMRESVRVPAVLQFRCRNCETSRMFISVVAMKLSDTEVEIMKIGEYPFRIPPAPPKLLAVLGSDKKLYVNGRRCEAQGWGIGAFGYYRQVVERQHRRLIDAIIDALDEDGGDEELVAQLRSARGAARFADAVEQVKGVFPDVLLIDGQNPLRLLYSAISADLHDGTDEECLAAATAIRTVLTHTVQRITLISRERHEVKQALALLNKARARPISRDPDA